MRGLLLIAALLSPAVAQAQSPLFTANGVIFDSQTLAPIDDVVVLVVDDATSTPLSPGLFEDPAQQGQITGADGQYGFVLTGTTGPIRIQLERPDVRFVFPSVLQPPNPIDCSANPCAPSQTPDGASEYAIRFSAISNTGDNAINNHIPIDPLGALVSMTFTADRQRAHLGGHVAYTVELVNRSDDPILDAEVGIALPPQLRYLARSAVGAEARQSDLNVVFPVALQPDTPFTIKFVTRVAGPIRGAPTVTTEAALTRTGGIRLAEGQTRLLLGGDPTLQTSTILGRVFCDTSSGARAGWQDEGERGLYGARVYLDTGFYVETDPDGLFSFTGAPPGMRLLKLDEGSLPNESVPRSPIRQQLYLSPGTPGKVRFAVDCRLGEWSRPTSWEVQKRNKKPKEGPPVPRARLLTVAIDRATRTLTLGDRVDRFTTARLAGELTPTGLRLHPEVIGPYTPTRWSIELARVDARGKRVGTVKDLGLTGRGYPPLFVEVRAPALGPSEIYRAQLKVVSGNSDHAASPEVDIRRRRAPPRPREQVARLSASEKVPPEVLQTLRTNDRRIVIEGHWEPSDDSGPQALALARSVEQQLLAEGVSADRLKVISKGGQAPIYPSLLLRTRMKNRRVELFFEAVEAEVVEAAPLPVPPASVLISVDKKDAEVPLVDKPSVKVKMDLDVPATIELLFTDEEGGRSRVRRVVTHDWIARPGQRKEVEPSVDWAEARVDLGPVEMPLPKEGPRIEAARLLAGTAGPIVELETRAIGAVRWRVELRTETGQVSRWGGAGAPPVPLTLVTTATVPGRLTLTAEYPGTIRVRTPPISIPSTEVIAATSETLEGEAIDDPSGPLQGLIDQAKEGQGGRFRLRLDGVEEAAREAVVAGIRALLNERGLEDRPIELQGGDPEAARRMEVTYVPERILPVPETVRTDAVTLLGLAAQPRIEASGRVLAIDERWIVPLPEIEAIERARPPSAKKAPEAEKKIDPAELEAAQVQMLVPEGELHRPSLPVTGRTVATNEISINGEVVAVSRDGRFAHTLELEPGDNRVVVESRDQDGNRARFERTVSTSSTTWFLMAMGDGTAALGGSRLAGSTDDSHIDVGPLSLDGRLLVYGKASFAIDGPFSRIGLVGRVDTAQQTDSTVLRLSDDPLRLLPTFGDASLEVQEAVSRHKLFLDVTVDRSQLRLGNGVTQLGAFGEGSLFNFRRSGFGVHGDLVKSFSTWDETRIAGTFSFENGGIRRGHDEVQGTGGAMYWLSNDELIEGSARVRLVVRDRDTGMVLATVEKAPGTDYEIRPREGRVTFREPVPHVVGFATTGLNRTVALTGHPIYVVVDYEFLAEGAQDKSYGVEVRETLFSQVELYFGMGGEDRADGEHRVFSGALAWRPAAGSFVELEYARSTGATTLGSLSVDGGLSYRSMDRPLDDAQLGALRDLDAPFFGAFNREAFGLNAHLDLADLSEAADGPRGFVHLYGRKAGLNYSALSAARDQGRLAGGISAAYAITQAIQARLRLDAGYSIQPEAIGTTVGATAPGVFRLMGVVGANYRKGDNALSADLVHARTSESGGRRSGNATGIGLFYERKLTRDLALSLRQDALFGADTLTGGGLGRFATTVGGWFNLHDNVQLRLSETVRWDGDNATQLGLRVQTDDGLTAYVAERFSQAGSEPRLTTIVGAEETVVEGTRTYGEMQMDAVNADRMRAVMGMDNRWRVAQGVELMLSYERAQLMSGNPAPNGAEPSVFEAPFGGVAATLGGFGSVPTLLPGAISRDALALGVTWSTLPWLKLSQRLELRVDKSNAPNPDYLILGTHTGLTLQMHRDVSAVGRMTFQNARDTSADRNYARTMEGSVSMVYRPRADDWFTLVLRYTKLIRKRPLALDPTGRTLNRDAISVSPIIDTPWNIQLVERVALVRDGFSADGLPDLDGWLVLWINRVNARFFDVVEAGVEYRMLMDLSLDTNERGFLIEAGYLPVEYVRIGLGYNFTRFSDDVLVLTSQDASGPFLRVTARY